MASCQEKTIKNVKTQFPFLLGCAGGQLFLVLCIFNLDILEFFIPLEKFDSSTQQFSDDQGCLGLGL